MSTIQLTVVTPGAFGAVAPPDRLDRTIDEALNVLLWEGVIVLALVAVLNYNLFFGEYIDRYDQSSWNSSEMGRVIADYAGSFGSLDSAWVVAHAHWVDTRLVAMNAGDPLRDLEIWPEELGATLTVPPPKLFIVKADDELGLSTLEQLYPEGLMAFHQSRVAGKEFLTFFVSAQVANH